MHASPASVLGDGVLGFYDAESVVVLAASCGGGDGEDGDDPEYP